MKPHRIASRRIGKALAAVAAAASIVVSIIAQWSLRMLLLAKPQRERKNGKGMAERNTNPHMQSAELLRRIARYS
jgi:hypothetical protein